MCLKHWQYQFNSSPDFTMEDSTNEKIAKKNLLRGGEEAEGLKIRGYDFDKGVNYSELIKSFSSTGFQASHFSKAIRIVNKMILEKAFIYLGYTSNMVSSGLRDVFRWLVKHKKVNVVVRRRDKMLGRFLSWRFQSPW